MSDPSDVDSSAMSDRCYVVTLERTPGTARSEALVRAHVAFLRALDAQGQLILAGPFEDGAGGMIVLRADSLAAARTIANSDPFVTEGSSTCEVREWLLSHEENNHLGMG